MRVTMRMIFDYFRQKGESPHILTTLVHCAATAGLTAADDDTTLLNVEFREKAIAFMRGELKGYITAPGVGFPTASGGMSQVPLGPDYISAATAFLDNPCEETLDAERAAYTRLVGHAFRVGDRL